MLDCIDRHINQGRKSVIMIRWPFMERLSLTNKSYARDNRLIIPKSSHCRDCLAPRCRLILSRISRKIQGYVCSTFKKVRELGLERRETVWFLSPVGVKRLRITMCQYEKTAFINVNIIIFIIIISNTYIKIFFYSNLILNIL